MVLACEKSTYTNKIKRKLTQAGVEVRFLKLPKDLDVNQCLLSSYTRKELMKTLSSNQIQHDFGEKPYESIYH